MSVRENSGRSVGMAVALLLLAGFAAGCHSSGLTSGITVTVTPASANVALQGTQQFNATLTNATDETVTWQVNKVTGGTTTCGMISANGLYTAPSSLPSSTACPTITITAISNQDTSAKGTATITLISGITITITPTGALTMGTGEHLSFTATVNGTGTNFLNTVNWLVDTVQGGNSTDGTICLTGTGPTSTSTPPCNPTTPGDGATAAIYYAPTTVPTGTITIEAQSVADTSQTATATVTLSAAAPPTLSAVSPTLIPQGALFQDLYLTGTNFLSTTVVSFGGQPITALQAASATVLRARIPGSLLSVAGPYSVAVAQQPMSGMMPGVGASATVNVVPVRPAGLTPMPANFLQQSPGGSSNLEVDGGYFTPSSSLAYNGTTKNSMLVQDTIANLALGLASTVKNADQRRITAGIGGVANDLANAGLFQASVSTPNASPSQVAVNVTVIPNYAATASPPAVVNTISALISTPVALGYDEVLGIPVVVNQGNNTLALLDSAFTTVINTIPVGMKPTGVAVDNVRHAALVADNGSSDVQAVDLVAQAPIGSAVSIPTTMGQGLPYAVGMDNIHGLAIVVGQNATAATLLNTSGLPANPPTIAGTIAVTTGAKPQVKVLSELGWAIITPGGTGSITVIDLVRSTTVFTAFLSPTAQGVALDPEHNILLLADPTTQNAEVFRLTDQSVAGVSLGLGSVATAINPLTNLGLVINPALREAFVLNLNTVTQISTVSLGSDPIAVQIAADANVALVADDVDNTVSVISFNPPPMNANPTRLTVGDPQILAISRSSTVTIAASPNGAVESGNTVTITTSAAHGLTTGDSVLIAGVGQAGYNGLFVVTVTSPTQFTYADSASSLAMSGGGTVVATAPNVVFTSNQSVPLTVSGAGFAPNAQIRLEGMGSPTVTTTFVNSRMLTAVIPASLLTGPRRVIVDVLNPSTGALSNVKNLYVLKAVAVGNDPAGVAVDVLSDVAVVANSMDNTASVVDISPSSPTFGTVLSTVTVGTTPAGVGILSRLGRAVIANSGEATATVLDLTTSPPTSLYKVPLGAQPSGVAVDEARGNAVVTSSGTNSVNVFSMTVSAAPQPSSSATGALPVAVGVASDLGVAVVATQTGNTADVFDISTGSPTLSISIPNLQEPVGVDYDPVTQQFLVLERAGNAVFTLNPINDNQGTLRTGVDPSSLAYNFQASTLLTLNTASNTLSVVDLPNSNVTELLPLSGSTQYALAIHPRLSLAVVTDSVNGRVLLLPMPR